MSLGKVCETPGSISDSPSSVFAVGPICSGIDVDYVLITDRRQLTDLRPLFDDDEKIEYIAVHWSYLLRGQLTAWWMYHNLVVIRTNKDMWWSIEKNTDGIVVQRSCKESSVLECLNSRRRMKVLFEQAHDVSEKQLKEVFDMISQLTDTYFDYNVVTSNCQHLAQAVFNFAAASKRI